MRWGASRAALAGALVLAGAGAEATSLQALSPAGRYALDRADCKAKSYFAVLTDTRIDLPTYSCTGVDYDLVEAKGAGATYVVAAKSCVGEGVASGQPKRFGLLRISSVLQFHWEDGTKSAKLVRCGK